MSTPAAKPRRVTFKADSLGMIRKDGEHGNKFEDATVGLGDEGTVLELTLPDGWIAVEPDAYPECYVPVHPSMVEVIE